MIKNVVEEYLSIMFNMDEIQQNGETIAGALRSYLGSVVGAAVTAAWTSAPRGRQHAYITCHLQSHKQTVLVYTEIIACVWCLITISIAPPPPLLAGWMA
ncbi:hypothetical protein JYU34_002741 [Plutella xylostella]|uniref:Uncharacterized protein n=1 Tax=Plutella xylostella TaxID=51655 RepID=A0ABQ7R310_PLUXY|nr:hypothetical protein JYU34_002741 [Plutella xylostella]